MEDAEIPLAAAEDLNVDGAHSQNSHDPSSLTLEDIIHVQEDPSLVHQEEIDHGAPGDIPAEVIEQQNLSGLGTSLEHIVEEPDH